VLTCDVCERDIGYEDEKQQRRSTRLSTAEADLGTAPTPQEPEGSREPSPEART
jgi:hypothetical protein